MQKKNIRMSGQVKVDLDVPTYVDNLNDITPDPVAEQFQHEQMYIHGLCDVEDQIACCCDEPPAKVEYYEDETPLAKFVPSDKVITIDELYSIPDEDGDLMIPEPVDDSGRTIGAYVLDKFKEMVDEILSNRQVFRFKEEEVPRAKRMVEEAAMSRDELIKKYITDEELQIIREELNHVIGYETYISE